MLVLPERSKFLREERRVRDRSFEAESLHQERSKEVNVDKDASLLTQLLLTCWHLLIFKVERAVRWLISSIVRRGLLPIFKLLKSVGNRLRLWSVKNLHP